MQDYCTYHWGTNNEGMLILEPLDCLNEEKWPNGTFKNSEEFYCADYQEVRDYSIPAGGPDFKDGDD